VPFHAQFQVLHHEGHRTQAGVKAGGQEATPPRAQACVQGGPLHVEVQGHGRPRVQARAHGELLGYDAKLRAAGLGGQGDRVGRVYRCPDPVIPARGGHRASRKDHTHPTLSRASRKDHTQPNLSRAGMYVHLYQTAENGIEDQSHSKGTALTL
jgi:hypothetical protein